MKKVEDEEELNIWDLSLEETEKKKMKLGEDGDRER